MDVAVVRSGGAHRNRTDQARTSGFQHAGLGAGVEAKATVGHRRQRAEDPRRPGGRLQLHPEHIVHVTPGNHDLPLDREDVLADEDPGALRDIRRAGARGRHGIHGAHSTIIVGNRPDRRRANTAGPPVRRP